MYHLQKSPSNEMLKWAVNKTLMADARMSIYCDDQLAHRPISRRSVGPIQSPIARHQPTADRRRKSLGSNAAVLRLQRRHNKENHIMVTPHPITMRPSPASSSPFSKADVAFREIGNLTPTPNDASLNATPVRKLNLPLSPCKATQIDLLPKKAFAPTLPTLDVQYSPSAFAPRTSAPQISLSGITIANTLFANARYFSDDQIPTYKLANSIETHTKQRTAATEVGGGVGNMQSASVFNNYMEEEDDLNMSSKALDDKALDKMINEILQSTRKPNNSTKSFQPSSAITSEIIHHQKRAVQTPECKLRRQCGVRRKVKRSIAETTMSADSQDDLDPVQIEMLAALNTPKDLRNEAAPLMHGAQLNHFDASKISGDSTPGIAEQDVQGSSTPTANQAGIRRCLRFPDSPDSMEDSLEKRKSVASSTASSSQCSKSASSGSVTGSVSLRIAFSHDMAHITTVHGELVKIKKQTNLFTTTLKQCKSLH